MNKIKILIGIILLFALLWVGMDIHRNRNLEFEYEEYNWDRFNMSLEYKQYLSDEINENLKKIIPEEIKKVFEENNLVIPDEAKMSRLQKEYWEISDGERYYEIDDTGKYLRVWDNVQGGYIKSTEWKNNTLVVDALVNGVGHDFTPHKFTVDYKLVKRSRRVEKNIIYLFASERTSFLSPECLGAYEFKFKIKNLEKKDYTIRLYKKSDLTKKGFYLVEEIFMNTTK